jgi:hypothetical protein
MDPNCKSIHARAYTVPRSVEQQLHKEIVRLVDIGVLEETIPLNSLPYFHHFQFLRKAEQ